MEKVARHPDGEVVALYQRSRDKAGDALASCGLDGSLYVDSFDDMIARDDVDAVFLCGPNHTHGPQAIAALEAGKHVFCEKPASIRYDEHLKLVELDRARPDQRTLVDYILYFEGFERRLRTLVADDALGKLTHLQVNYRHAVNIAGEKAWKLDRSIMGDAIGMGINHAVSTMLFAKAPQAEVASVYATSQPAHVRGFEADPIWTLQLTFTDGASGVVLGNIDSGNGYDAYHSLYGVKGAIVFDSLLDRPRKVRMWREGVADGQWVYPLDAEACAAAGVEAWPADTSTPDSGDVINHGTTDVVDHFLDCVTSGEDSPLSFANSATVADVNWAARVSALTRRPVDFPLNPEPIASALGEPAANGA